MKKGAYVLIFLVWAFITIVTPTLVQWSFVAADEAQAQAQAQAQVQNQATAPSIEDKPSDEEGTTVRQYRRMLVLIDGINRRNVPLAEPAVSPDSEVQQTAASQTQPFEQGAERWTVDIMSETLPFIY
ncbi:uncharacterized protein LOC110721979 [Chenopodium quinoa]|uniref:uncharacterized protein LOC110721979 n=1 Tax=Chenopodium quinoa TaxID=63459 RepID=UPI000B789C68|nr:uncharacterized protein LOC110721979 [Chenopodium quinoa]